MEMSEKIIVIDDNPEIREVVNVLLSSEGYTILEAKNAEEALEQIDASIDLIILDIMMPGMDGYQLCAKLREVTNAPVLFLSAKGQDSDKTLAFSSGGDDYLTKPFSVEELLARLRVTQRRLALIQNVSNEQAVYQNGPLRIDYSVGCAYLGDNELSLTAMEYKLLCLLARNTGKVLTHRFILQNVWGSSWENDIGSLRVFMATLRKKLEKTPGAPQYIQTHIGVGYRMQKVE